MITQGREKLGLNQSELARRLKVTPQAVQAWESGRSIPRPQKLIEIAAELKIPSHSLLQSTGLLSGPLPDVLKTLGLTAFSQEASIDGPISAWDDDTPIEDDEVSVPFLKEVELSAGSGRTAVELSTNRKLRFGKTTLRNQGVQFDKAVCVTVHGDSMAPILPDGSTVGVDTGSTVVRDGKTYAINQGGQLRVKTLHRLPDGGIRLRSFNRDEYPDEEYTLEEMEQRDMSIIGRVFWSSVLW
ncbi:helix-turn-helix transcriptional regulator [Pseudomonas sp. NFACC37-1]|uniref:S24 family peptidase n=1 Tax=Pseudomonas sp. NFACC37-1 TaxID=1566196 RepID=UPI000B89FCED|nr:helix-turn-helix transcriptional regulator [Pseudomonas sp. NFACC37-1]